MTLKIDPEHISLDAPLRLAVAARLEFPDGSMSVSGLRREAMHGRLSIMRIAGKDYTTRGAIREMFKQCVQSNRHDSSGEGAALERNSGAGSSKTKSALSAH